MFHFSTFSISLKAIYGIMDNVFIVYECTEKSKIFDRAIKHYKGESMTIEWEEFLDPYIQAVGELKIKLREFANSIVSKTSILRLSL